MWPFRPKKDTDTNQAKGALMGALLAFQSSPVLHLREDALPALLTALSVEPQETGTDRVFVGSRPVAVAYWGGEGEDDDTPYTITSEGVAIIPVCGTLINAEPEYWFRWYGYCSTPMIGRMLDMAREDARVSSILLYLSSPGGHSAGITEVAAKIRAIRDDGEKRVLGAGDDICSAAYHLGSQCEKLYISKSGFSGCIGTLMTPSDWSEAYAQFGVKRLRITSTGGETYKGAGVHGTKISAEQVADWKRLCDEIQALFNADVMQARGFDEAQMQSLADGRYWTGAVGVQQKLVDGVASAADVLAALGSGGDVACEGATSSPDDQNDPDDPASDDDTATESSRGNQEEPMDEKTQQSLADKIVAGLKGIVGNRPDAAKLELEKLQAENKKREQDALASARESATAAAVAAYGPGTDALASAQKAIESCADVAVLGELESAYKAKAATGPSGRQTASPAAAPAAAPAAPAAENAGVTADDYKAIYNNFNRKGA